MRDSSSEPTPEVKRQESPSGPGLLQAGSEHPEREHVYGDVKQPGVHEHVADRGPPDSREAGWVQCQRPKDFLGRHERDLEQKNTDVQRQQPPYRRRVSRRKSLAEFV